MGNIIIIYPALVMFALTAGLVLSLGLKRFLAIKRGEVSVKYYRLYTEGKQPERLHILTRHVQNHFEVPPLFYVGIILTYITDSVMLISIISAWLYVAFRGLHSCIHLGSNNVSYRFLCFGCSMMALTVLWVSLFVSLLAV